MNKVLLLFNIVFYAITWSLFFEAKDDPGSGLGYGIIILAFWVISFLVLMFLLYKKLIEPVTLADKIAVITATPLLSFLVILLLKWIS